MRHFASFLALASATDVRGKGDCDLSAVPGLFVGESGKLNYGEHYKLKRGRRNPANGEKLVNPGKILKGRGLLKHTNDAEFSDAWVTCTANKMSSFAVRCYPDGSFTINGASGSAAVLPACEPIGCDPAVLPFTGMTDKCRYGYHQGVGLEKNGNKCERTCQNASGATVTSKRKIKCACDLVARSPTFGDCEYKVFDNNEWKAWNAVKANGKPIVDTAICDGDQPVTDPPKPGPVTDPVTDPPVTEPKWGEWGEWNACSAGCGEGAQSRSRECISGVCDGPTTESKSCVGPDGADCPEGCKLNVGDFEQGQGKTCSEMFRGPDGFYLPKSGRCGNLKCGNDGNEDEKTWVCVCTKKSGCGIKVNGKAIADTEFGADFDSVTTCKGNLGGRIDGNKRYRWADGRRSTAQPESEVSGGDDWELMNVCYNRYVYDFPAMKAFAADGDDDLPFESREEWTASLTYGTVVEREDGVLVCRYSSGKYDWSEDHEIYLQLSVKRGQMQWLSSELWWPYYDGYADEQPHGLFDGFQLVTQAADTMSNKYIEMNNWPDKLGGDPSYRFLCRMEHNGKWYNGAATREEFNWGVPWRATTSSWSSSTVRTQFPHCTAIADDGTVLTAKAHNKFYDSEQRRGGPKTQYLVALADDGSYWGDWGEFGACPGWCGPNLKREKTRPCFNGDGEEIDPKKSNNCLPDMEVTYPEDRWDDIVINKITWGTIKDKCEDDDILSKQCPDWSSWSEFGECSVTCGAGAEQRTRECICTDGWGKPKHVCAEMDHPLAAEGLCGDVSESVDSRQCLKGSCGGEGLAEGDGEGLGCKSDSLFTNPHKMVHDSMYGFTCYNSAGAYEEVQWQTYENEYGFVPHNYACWYDNETCGSRFNMPSQQIIKNKPAICSCNEGECKWTQVERQDCTRGYEWIKMPINDMANHPLADKIVDFENPSSAEPAQTAITGGWDGVVVHTHPNRRIASPVPITGNTLVHTDGHHTAWVLTHECEEGGLEWIEGPFDCSPYELPYSEAKDKGWYCLGEPRLYPMTDGKGIYTEYSPLFKHFPARIFGICRFKDENDAWVIGDLIKHEVFRRNSSRKTKFQCCPAGGSLVGEVTGCQDDNLWRPNGDYDSRPYQILYSGKCKTKGMAGWSAWSEWGACSKTCDNGAITGTRSKTRTCENGEVGEFGCNDSTIVEISEPCGMNLQCHGTDGCTLDMNFVDFHRFRLSHVDGIKTSDYWQAQGVYTNRKEDLFADPRDWSGFFPAGSMVASFRCFNPNDNKLSGEEHDATCVCSDGVCAWDREMPVCTQHNTNHAGYSWLMPAKPNEGAFCVAANYGGVGVVTNGACTINMATLPTEDKKGLQYFKTTSQFVSIDGVADSVIQELFDSTYASFNVYYGDQANNENDFYALSSPCGPSAFKWVPADQFSAATSVHLPTTFAWLHMNWSARFQHETAHLCRVTYANGKECFGRFVNGTCGDIDATYATVDVLTLDTDNCSSSLGAWSECSGDTGVQCGPGTQTRGEETRSCRGTCMTDELVNYGYHDAPDPNPRYQCNMPSYPTECHLCMNKRTYHKNKNDGSITMARYPLSSALIDFDKIKMTCSGGGYWDVDYLTGDRYYAPAANEQCQFSCTDSLYKLNGYGYSSATTKATCSDRGFLDDDFQFTPPDEDPLFCDPNFCAFPSFGHWPVTDNKQQGTRVSMGIECEGQIDNGDHVMVAQGAKCNVVCVADNGKAYRADSTVSTFWCEDPIHREKLADYGCKGGKCLSDWLAAPWDLDDWSWSESWRFLGQSREYNKGTMNLDDMNEHKKLQKCYKVVDSTCDVEPPINSDESDIADKVSWNCDNANEAGSSCNKVCGSGTRPGGQKQTKTCDCTGSCQWKGQVTSCVPALCQLPEDRYWPSGIVCKTPDGVIQNGPDYPEGTDCAEPCEGEGYKYELWQSDSSTCVCDHQSGKCAFDSRKVNSCIIAACSIGLEWMLKEFEEGFDYDGAAIEHFSDEVECDSRWPDDHPDQALAGMVPEGTNCYIKCKAGHEFKDEEVNTDGQYSFVQRNGTTMYSITCRDTHYHGLEWDVFDSAWDKYGDCGFISNYGFQCDTYPQCAPV